MYDLSITGGTLVIPGQGQIQANVGIRDGKIVSISSNVDNLSETAQRTVDATHRYVLPGIIDPHVHIGNHLPFERETETETRSALAGGITTVGCFLRSKESYLPHFETFRRTVEDKASCDVFFHLQMLNEEHIAEIPRYAREFGIQSFKFYMFGVPGLVPWIDDAVLFRGFQKVAELGPKAIACVHCENGWLCTEANERLKNERPEGTLADWSDAHPNIAEELAVMTASYLSYHAGTRLYIVHLNTAEAARRLRKLKQEYNHLTVESTSTYLSVTKHDSVGLIAKMVPPVRDKQDVEELWKAVQDGTIDTFGTDHTPRTREAKAPEKGLHGSRSGIPGVATHLPALLHEGCYLRGIPLETVVDRATRRPAQAYGLYPQKGTIAVGSDADLVIVDLNLERSVNPRELHSFSDYSLHEGRTLRGWPVMTIKSGTVAVENNEILAQPGLGRYLARTL